ncbi:MAG TPA: hypothetical protein VGC41_07855 [Kofleriaceae bacterium]
MKGLALALVFAFGCHDASKDLEKLVDTCKKCPGGDRACAEKTVDDLVAYVKANPDPVGNEQNAADQLKALAECAQAHGVDGNALVQKTKGLGAKP